jgi:hypothetical protein
VNAGLAKPIHANWFIRPQPFDLSQLNAAALFGTLPSWLRDHLEPAEFMAKCCGAQSENFNALCLIGDAESFRFAVSS